VLGRLTAIGEKATRIREHFARREYDDSRRGGRHDHDGASMPPLVRAALENLRDVAGQKLGADADAETRIVEVLARAAQEIKKN
jgi:hypothetical protein